MKIDDAILKKLADEDDMPDFVCPNCGGAFFTRLGLSKTIECDTITDSFRCTWKGPESECLLPSRASLAEEILKLRRAVAGALPHVAMATSVTSGRDFKETAETLLAEMRDLLGTTT